MKKHLLMTAVLATSSMLASNSNAGFLDDLAKVATAAQVVNDVSNAVSSQSESESTKSTSSQTEAPKAKDFDFKGMSQCTNDQIWGVFAGYDRQYSGNDKGQSYKTHGFLDYVEGRGTSRCSLPEVSSPRCLYFITKESAYQNAGGEDLQMQCFYKDDPTTMITDKSLYPHDVHYFKPEQMITRCGNDKGDKNCMSGDDSARAEQHKQNISKHQGKDFSMCLPHGPQEREVFCQYVNPKTNQSLFKVEFTQTTK